MLNYQLITHSFWWKDKLMDTAYTKYAKSLCNLNIQAEQRKVPGAPLLGIYAHLIFVFLHRK